MTFVKEYFRAIDLLKQSGHWSNSAGDFLPLALANWSHRPVCIYSSRPEQPVIEIQPTLCPPTEENSICLAYMSSGGISNHYDRCKKNPIEYLDKMLLDNGQEQKQMANGQKQSQNGDGDNENSLSSFAADIISTPNGENVSEQEILVDLNTSNEPDICPDGTKPDEDDGVGDYDAPTWQFTAELYEADQNSISLEEFFWENNLEDIDISTSDLNISSDINTSTADINMPDNDSSPKQATPRKAAKYLTQVTKKLTRKRTATPEAWKKCKKKTKIDWLRI